MYRNILLDAGTQLKNGKVLKEVSKLVDEDTVVTALNAINEQDVQASIKVGVHLNELIEERSKRLEKTRKALEDYGVDYNQVVVRDNAKEELLKYTNSSKYGITILGSRKAEDKKKSILGSVNHKVAKRATIPVLTIKQNFYPES